MRKDALRGAVRKSGVTVTAALLAAAALQGCAIGTIQGVTGQQSGTGPVRYFPYGQGKCDKIGFDFGDMSPIGMLSSVDFASTTTIFIDHAYAGWGGKKTVKVLPEQNCAGSAQTTFTVAPTSLVVALTQPTTKACSDFSAALSKPPLRKNTTVHITTTANVRIDFGCALGGCVHDADGENSMAPSNYPFPGLRKYSMVIRVGTQVEQGGTNKTITTSQVGALEVCVNDDNIADNSGAWGVHVEIDESAAM